MSPPVDRTVTDAEFFAALRVIAMYGDIDELPAEPDDVAPGLRDGTYPREQELRELFSALFARLGRGEALPATLGFKDELAVVNRWLAQRARDPRRGRWKCAGCGQELTVFAGEQPSAYWRWSGTDWRHTCMREHGTTLLDPDPK